MSMKRWAACSKVRTLSGTHHVQPQPFNMGGAYPTAPVVPVARPVARNLGNYARTEAI